jgi:hypothetical protein
MPIHGGPTFREWQATKLPPSHVRAVNQLRHDAALLVAPLVDWAMEFFDTLMNVIGDMLETVAAYVQPALDMLTQLCEEAQCSHNTSPAQQFPTPSLLPLRIVRD